MVMKLHWGKNLRGGSGFEMPESWMKKEQLFQYSPYVHLAAKKHQDLSSSEVGIVQSLPLRS